MRCLRATARGLSTHVGRRGSGAPAPADRLRIDYKGRIFSIRPDLDYIPLCVPCHKRHDSWKKALPSPLAAAAD